MKIDDEEFDYRKPMPKKEKRRKKLLHKIQVLRNKNNEQNTPHRRKPTAQS